MLKENMSIKDIEALTQEEMEVLKAEGKAELLNIKEHDCYFINIPGYFGYSVLVFKNNHHIYYANDYQLHHGSKTIEELKPFYIESLNRKLYTEEELMQDVQSYDEKEKKATMCGTIGSCNSIIYQCLESEKSLKR